jgi:hypothetical protein
MTSLNTPFPADLVPPESCPPDCVECTEASAQDWADIEDEYRAALAAHDTRCIAEAIADAFATGHDTRGGRVVRRRAAPRGRPQPVPVRGHHQLISRRSEVRNARRARPGIPGRVRALLQSVRHGPDRESGDPARSPTSTGSTVRGTL